MSIIATFNTPKSLMAREGRFILVHRENPYTRYVTAWQGYDATNFAYESSWIQGHYFDTRKAAREDFIARITKWTEHHA